MGYVNRVGDKKYRIVYDLPRGKDGKRHQKTETLVGKTKGEAEAYLIRRQEQLRIGQPIIDEALTLGELYKRFMDEKRTYLATTTLERYAELYKRYLHPAFGDVRVSSLGQANLAEAYSKWSEQGCDGTAVSGRTIRHAHDVLRNILGWGVRRELVTRNVASLLRGGDLPRAIKPEPRALSGAEVKRVLQTAKSPSNRARKRGGLSSQSWFYPAVAFSIHTGARRGEVVALRWSDVNLLERTATIRQSLSDTKEHGLIFKEPKNGKVRTIMLPSTLARILLEHQEVQAEVKLARFRGYFPLGGERSTNGQKTSAFLPAGLQTEDRRACPIGSWSR